MHRDFAIMHEIDPKDPEKKKKSKKQKAKEEAYINEKKKESKKNKEEEEDGFGKAINTYKRLGNVRHRRRLCLSFFAMFLSPCLFVGLVV